MRGLFCYRVDCGAIRLLAALPRAPRVSLKFYSWCFLLFCNRDLRIEFDTQGVNSLANFTGAGFLFNSVFV